MGISIAMCTYNGASYLPQQLASFSAQTRLPDELIICDDGSTDATIAILEAFAASAPFTTRIVRNPQNLGYSRNFAQAVMLCSQEIIALSDQDDIWYPNKLAHIARSFHLDPAVDGVFSDGDLMGSDSKLTGRKLWASFLFNDEDLAHFNSGSAAVDVLLQRNVVTGMAFAFRSRMKNLLSSVPGSWVHDGWLALLIAARSKLIADPECLVAYRLHSTQQIGAPASPLEKLMWLRTNGIGAYAKKLRDRNLVEYERTALQSTQLVHFLRQEARPEERDLIARLERKAAHSQRGATALGSARLRRLMILLPHLDSYLDFSPNAFRLIVRDLLI